MRILLFILLLVAIPVLSATPPGQEKVAPVKLRLSDFTAFPEDQQEAIKAVADAVVAIGRLPSEYLAVVQQSGDEYLISLSRQPDVVPKADETFILTHGGIHTTYNLRTKKLSGLVFFR